MPHLDLGAFEYAMGLFSVVIGLAVIDVATSFHALLRRRREVRWDPLTLLVAAYALCMAVYMWFDIWGVRGFGATRYFLFYLGLVAEFVVLFLAAAASLPDPDAAVLDLRAYYAENRRYFWTLVTLFQVGYTAFGFYFSAEDIARAQPAAGALILAEMAAPTAVAAVLMLVRPRWAHYLGVAVLFLLMIAHYAPARIA